MNRTRSLLMLGALLAAMVWAFYAVRLFPLLMEGTIVPWAYPPAVAAPAALALGALQLWRRRSAKGAFWTHIACAMLFTLGLRHLLEIPLALGLAVATAAIVLPSGIERGNTDAG